MSQEEEDYGCHWADDRKRKKTIAWTSAHVVECLMC